MLATPFFLGNNCVDKQQALAVFYKHDEHHTIRFFDDVQGLRH